MFSNESCRNAFSVEVKTGFKLLFQVEDKLFQFRLTYQRMKLKAVAFCGAGPTSGVNCKFV